MHIRAIAIEALLNPVVTGSSTAWRYSDVFSAAQDLRVAFILLHAITAGLDYAQEPQLMKYSDGCAKRSSRLSGDVVVAGYGSLVSEPARTCPNGGS